MIERTMYRLVEITFWPLVAVGLVLFGVFIGLHLQNWLAG